MNEDSDLMWLQLQARLDQRFGKYFKIDEKKRDHKTPKRKSQKDVNIYKTSRYSHSE